MQVQERLIVPGLGVIILLSIFMLGAPLIYLLLLGLLGLAAVGTYYVPHAVQVETRIGIAALGLLILIFYFSSLGFWLALLAFGTIGALQIRYRDALQNPPQTIAWLNMVLARRGTAGAGGGGGGAAPAIVLPAILQGKVSIAGIAAAVLGIIVLLTPAMPWYSFGFGGESTSYSGWAIALGIAVEEGTILPFVFIGVLAALALVSVASVLLPRVVPIIVGIAGLVVTILAMVYIALAINSTGALEAGVALSYGIGAYLTALAFIIIAVLHFIPATYKPIGKDNTGD